MLKKRKMLYIAPIRYPTEKAHGIAIAKMCEAFNRHYNLQLIVPQIKQNLLMKGIDANELYNIRERFLIKSLFCIDLSRYNRYLSRIFHTLNYWIMLLSFYFAVSTYIRKTKAEIVYTRDINLTMFIIFLNKKIYVEMHNFPVNKYLKKYYKFLDKFIKGYVVINKNLKEELIKIGIDQNKILLAASGVDKQFFIRKDRNKLRIKYNYPQNKKIILYSGSFQKGKGVEFLLSVARKMEQEIFIIIGDYNKNEKLYKLYNKCPNIIFTGYIPYNQIADHLYCADILVIPNDKKSIIYSTYTSPMKLWEYLATGKPVIVSKVPGIENLVSSDDVIFYEPDNSQDLIYKINNIERLVKKTQFDVSKFTWEKRAENIAHFI